jgi:hypothetical protein
LIVIRAWREDDHVRARILVDDEPGESWVVDCVEDVSIIVERLLRDLEPKAGSR